jgi:thiol:disulfide interchange protein DsbD
LSAQINGVLSVSPPAKVFAKPGAKVDAKISVLMQSGYHTNSNTPSESYLIPLRLTWTPGTLEAAEVVFPKPHMEQYSFSPKPLSVFTGDFEIVTKFKVAVNAPAGPGVAIGKLRYQACNNNSCLAPKVVEVKLPYQIQ